MSAAKGPSVARRSASAAAITAISRVFARGLQLLSSLILTRLLLPEAFGLMAQAAVLLQMLQLLSDLGMQTALIQLKNGHRRAYLDAAFAIALIRSLALFSMAILAAGPVAHFYGDSRLEQLIYILSISIILQGLENPAYATVIKNLQARTQALLESGTALATLAITVALVLNDRSVWSLAAGSVCGVALRVLGTYVVARPLPRPRFRRGPMLKLLALCGRLLVNTLVTWLAMNLDVLGIGRILDMEQLGYYNIGRNLALTGELLLIPIIARSYFPAAAELLSQRDSDSGVRSPAFARLYRQHAVIFAGLGGLGQVALALVAGDLVTLLYPEAYVAVVPVVALLALRGVFRIVSILQSGLLFAAGRTGVESFAMLTGLCALAGGLLWFSLTTPGSASRVFFADAAGALTVFGVPGPAGELALLGLLVFLAAVPITAVEAFFLLFRLRVRPGAVLSPYAAALAAPVPLLLAFALFADFIGPGLPRLAFTGCASLLIATPVGWYYLWRRRKFRSRLPARKPDECPQAAAVAFARPVLHCTLLNPARDRNGVAVHINGLIRERAQTMIAAPGAYFVSGDDTDRTPVVTRVVSQVPRLAPVLVRRLRDLLRNARSRTEFTAPREWLFLLELGLTATALRQVMRARLKSTPGALLHCHDIISAWLALGLCRETVVLTAHFWCHPEDEFARAGLVRSGTFPHTLLRRISRHVLAHPRIRIVSVSHAARAVLAKGVRSEAGVVIPPCIVSSEAGTPARPIGRNHRARKRRFRIVLVGTLEARKDQRRLIRIARILRRASAQAEFHIFGDDANREGRILQALVERNALGDIIRLHGARDPAEVQAALAEADLYLQLSRAESFGMALVEAMGHGRAVLAREYPALAEIAPACAILARHANSREIAHRIQILARAPRRRHWNAMLCREIYEQRFTPERVRLAHEDLYAFVAGDAAPGDLKYAF